VFNFKRINKSTIDLVVRLRRVNSWFYFNDSPLKQFPEFIPHSTQLETVIFEGVYFDSIPTLDSLVNVERWEFYGCHLKKFPNAILSLSNLKHLTLACDEYTEIPEEISRLTKLESLNFDGGACGSTPIQTIPKSLGQLKNLSRFTSENFVVEKSEMPEFFKKLPIKK
jgi:Leucine-rich repeat (LRR) protein